MKLIEKIKLVHRANKYRNKDDKGGIQYILESIKKGQTVLDIGAHKGGYLYFMQQLVGDKGKVFAFEPQSTLYQYLVKIKTLFNWQNVSVAHLAISGSAGTVTLYIPSNKSRPSSPGATIIEHPERDDMQTREEVATETLDAWCEKNNVKPDLLKIDVEGNELSIFQGATGVLKKYKPKIIVECEARHVGKEKVKETFQFLTGLGYKGRFILDTDFLPLEDFDFDKHQNSTGGLYCNNFIFE